jgi:hypothetical protein
MNWIELFSFIILMGRVIGYSHALARHVAWKAESRI